MSLAKSAEDRHASIHPVALVTGASRGIGRATAIRLAADFAAVVLVARDPASLETTAAEVGAAGADALPVAQDLRKTEAARQIVDTVMSRFGRVDALVNIAGAVSPADLFELTDAEWDDGLALKFHGARRLTLQAWDALKASRGAVVFTSGSTAIVPTPAMAAVGSINAAIVALAKAFAERGIADGVQVNSILPGPVMTDRRQGLIVRYAADHALPPGEAEAHFARSAGIARLGQPQDIANTVAFLVFPPARWLTGAALRIDGGEVKSL
jgi:NAD(P)-dependent dehydrogenase (short-subunit alcohol dehydrogenase family)